MSDMIKTLLACLALLGGGLAWGVTNFVVKTDFEKHLENDEQRYVLELKKALREMEAYMREDPEDPYLQQDYQETLDLLCEIRPEDRLCQ